jgi:ectoine hydrolase
MSAAELSFDRSEYDARIVKTRTAMDKAAIELMIVTDPSNISWLTGYDGWSFYVHQCVLLGLEGEPVWWGRLMDSNGAKLTAFMSHDNIVAYPDIYVQSTERHPMDHLSGVILERGWDKATIGVEMDNYYFSAAAFASLQGHLGSARFKDATGLVNWQRAVKSARELQYIKRAARIVEAMHARILEMVEPGLKKNELVAEVYRTGILGADGHGGDYPAIVPMLGSGRESMAPHLTWNDQPLKVNEGTFFEIAGCYRRYHCPQSRTIFLGNAPQKYLDAESAVLEGIAAGLEAAMPGNTCEDIAKSFFAALRRHGFGKESRAGYSIGLSYPPDWGERTMSLRLGDRTLLETGMVFHFMPTLWLDDGALQITEPIMIGELGCELLCRTPRQLFVKR